MIIKKFQGKTESEATEAAKKELGSGVVIMNVRTVKRKGLAGLFRAPITEVTVALEAEPEKAVAKTESEREKAVLNPVEKKEEPPKQMTALEQLALQQRKLAEQGAVITPAPNMSQIIPDNRQDTLEEKLDSLEHLLKERLEEKRESDVKSDASSSNNEGQKGEEQIKFTKLLYNTMLDNEVHEKYANQIIEDAEKTKKPNMPFDYMLTNIYQKMILKFGNPSTITPAPKGVKVVYFVGPTGVGKTTTIAKIASKLCVEEKRKVALLTADTYRIAAAEQLRTYANILEVPFRIIYSPSEVEQSIEEFKDYDFILVDTAGHSHHNEEQRNNTNLIIHAASDIAESEVYLVLSATTKYRDLVSIADTYREMSDYKIIFTKLDETTCFGNILNLKLYTGRELSYVTYGQNVPEDIDRFNPQSTVKSILGGNS